MKEQPNMTVLSDTFDLYMRKGKEAKAKGNLTLAKRNFLLAGETMMQMAKQSQGKLKEARMERARTLVDLSENLGKKPMKVDKKENGKSDSEDDDVKKWQAAKVPDIKFSDVAGLDEVKKAITSE